MNFDLTEDQVQIQETVRRLMTDRYSASQRQGYLAQETGWSIKLWRAYADMGLTALHVPVEYGGLGGSAADQYVVMQELGRAVVLEPYLGCCVAAAMAISHGGNEQQRSFFLPRIATGEMILSWANHEEGANHCPNTLATACSDGWQLSGLKTLVLHGASAAWLVVSACVPGGDNALFLVPGDASGLTLRSYRLVDGSSAADVRLDGVGATLLGSPDAPAAGDVISRTESACIAATCAEAVGAMRAAFDLTITHLNTRTQFDRPLSSNQVLRHRIADMAVMLECSESMAMLAAITQMDSEGCLPSDLHSARMVVNRYGRSLCEQAIQLHGGIGMSEEYGLGRYLQRLMVIEQLFVNS